MYKPDGVTIIAGALPMEVKRILKLGTFKKAELHGIKYHQGSIRDMFVGVFVSGVGDAAAYDTAKAVCTGLNVRSYISVGLSGSLSTDVRVGEVVIGDSTGPLGSAVRYPSNPLLLEDAERARGELTSIVIGGLAVSPEVILKAARKREVASAGILAVDMETSGAARAATEAGVPFVAIRAISDGFEQDMPLDFNMFMRDGKMDMPGLLMHIAGHPGTIPQLIKLGWNSGMAARNIAIVVETLLFTEKQRDKKGYVW